MNRTSPISQLVRFYRAGQGLRFMTLLASLILLFVAIAIVSLLQGPTYRYLAGISIALLFDLVLLSAVNAVHQRRRTMKVAIYLAVPTALLSLTSAAYRTTTVLVISNLLSVAFITLVIILVLDFLFRSEQVDANMICASLCIYLLLGIVWASIYTLCEVLQPGSFVYAYADDMEKASMVFGGEKSLVPIYYSFVTLTTLGYGDMVPFSPPAKILAILEAVIGQIYLTVLVARLVGLHIAHVTSRSSGDQ